jgi:anoctamin-10
MTQKIFVLNFLTSYMSLFLTAYVYGTYLNLLVSLIAVPFGSYIVPKLDIFQVALPRPVGGDKQLPVHIFEINHLRLRQQLIYFSVTGQIVGFAVENFLPYVTRKAFSEARKITHMNDEGIADFDRDEEKPYLDRVREESELPEYDIYTDYAEMVVQVLPIRLS